MLLNKTKISLPFLMFLYCFRRSSAFVHYGAVGFGRRNRLAGGDLKRRKKRWIIPSLFPFVNAESFLEASLS